MPSKKQKLVTEEILDKRFEEFTDFMTKLHENMVDELYKIRDIIVGEIKDYREEHDTHQASHMRINDELNLHDKRIKKLETTKN
jgi:hypothetical protein